MATEKVKIVRSFLMILILQCAAFSVVNGCEERTHMHNREDVLVLNKELPEEIKSPFKFIGGLMFVEVTVNGVKGLLLVDTGSNSFMLLNSEYFKTTATGQTLKGMGGNVGMEVVKIELLEWQNLKLQNRSLPAIKMNQLNTGTDEKVLGLIGSAFFKTYQLTLNFASRKLDLKKAVAEDPILKNIPPTIKVPFVLVNGFPIVEVSIGGKNHRFVMDTGATDNLIDTSYESEIGSMWKQTQEVKMTEGSGNSGNVRRGVLDQMTIGGLNMDKIQMGFHAMPAFDKEIGISGILGFQFLKYFYVDINYIDKTMKFYDMAVVMRQSK